MKKELMWYWFCNIKGIGIVKQRNLIEYFENIENVFNAKIEDLREVKRITDDDITNIILSKDAKKIENSYNELKKQNVRFINIEDEDYPNKLKEVYDRPFGLYCKGKMPDNNKRCIAMVGARNCTEYGIYMAKTIAKAISDAGGQVVSGFARGIDTFSHVGAINGKTDTFAVFGCGVDVCYPTENIELYDDILGKGGIISEYPPKTGPFKGNFPLRNRIISGMSDAVIVIEARKKSGSLITVDQALEQGKEVYALPGRVTDPLSYGCLNLIKYGANMITSIDELLEELGLTNKFENNASSDNATNNIKNAKKDISLEPKKEKVYSSLSYTDTKNIENIIQEVDLEAREVSAILFELELMGLVRKVSNNYYIKA